MTLAFIATFRIGKIPLHHPPAGKAIKQKFVCFGRLAPRRYIFTTGIDFGCLPFCKNQYDCQIERIAWKVRLCV
jgi:hypothetical protein